MASDAGTTRGERSVRKVLTTIPACLLLIIGAAVTGAPAVAAPAPGTVVSSTSATLPRGLAEKATAVRIAYKTTDVNGALIDATGLIMTPRGRSVHKTVVWGHGTTGLADQCAPSQNQAVFWEEARLAVAELLSRGWTVAAPDYPGLGTPGPHPYLIGDSEGRAIIDSVKAARNLDATLSTQYALDGHSQGGQGALFAGELAPGYDGPLELRGVATIAPASNVDQLAPLIPGTPGQGYLVMALAGLATVDPSVNPATLLAEPAERRAPVLLTGCLYEILDAYAPLTAEELLNGGRLPAVIVRKLAQRDNPGQRASSAPILIVQGTADDAVPEFATDLLVEQLQQYSQPVQVVKIEGGTHDSAVIDSTVLVADWIAGRFG
jgi:pimeloyl-ACP methyl ester carboxylesterase